jgi:hypothetical protein
MTQAAPTGATLFSLDISEWARSGLARAGLPVGAVQVGLRFLAGLRHAFRGTFGRRYEKRR